MGENRKRDDMSIEDYQKFANMLAGEIASHKYNLKVTYKIRAIILSTADIFKHDNLRFDREKFYLACGLDENGGLRL